MPELLRQLAAFYIKFNEAPVRNIVKRGNIGITRKPAEEAQLLLVVFSGLKTGRQVARHAADAYNSALCVFYRVFCGNKADCRIFPVMFCNFLVDTAVLHY